MIRLKFIEPVIKLRVILKITEKGIMYDEKVPLKIKRFLRFAPLICSVITFLFFNQVTNKGLIDWLIIILATLGVYIFIYIFLRMNITHNETKN
jgi:energy-coupling factor transporter transmembrane protein EcfT